MYFPFSRPLFFISIVLFQAILILNACNSSEELDKKISNPIEESVKKFADSVRQADSIKQTKTSQNNFSTTTKFIYVKVLTEEPTGQDKIPGTTGSVDIDPSGTLVDSKYIPGTEDKYVATWHRFVYNSTIARIENYSEDKKFELMDDFISKLDLRWILLNDGSTVTGKIIDRKCLEFNSYAEASEHKFSHKTEF